MSESAAVAPQAAVKPASTDIRMVQRQTTDAAAIQMQPPPGMTFIPGGQVLVGTDPAQVTDLGQNDHTQMMDVLAETPRHPVTVDPYFIDTTEVTNLQWKVYLDATGRKPSATLAEIGWPEGAIPAGQQATDASLRARLAAALDCNRQLADENARLRRQLARAFGDQRSSRPRSGNDPTR